MPRKHLAQAIPVPTHIRAPDFRKAKSSVSQCVNPNVLFWFQIIGCSDRSITCNPSGVPVERKPIVDSPKKRYAIHNTSISLILLCEAPHPRRLYSEPFSLLPLRSRLGVVSYGRNETWPELWAGKRCCGYETSPKGRRVGRTKQTVARWAKSSKGPECGR